MINFQTGNERSLKNGEVNRGQEAPSEQGAGLLRRQCVLQLHARDVVVQRHRQDLSHGADQAVLLAAVLDHQRVRLVRVEHDVVGRHDQHATHHALPEPTTLVSVPRSDGKNT